MRSLQIPAAFVTGKIPFSVCLPLFTKSRGRMHSSLPYTFSFRTTPLPTHSFLASAAPVLDVYIGSTYIAAPILRRPLCTEQSDSRTKHFLAEALRTFRQLSVLFGVRLSCRKYLFQSQCTARSPMLRRKSRKNCPNEFDTLAHSSTGEHCRTRHSIGF